ncbi:hypothetical protein PIB30_006086 [Stylosanthes scabra]|uniref:Uncharacterized protein n=1 Tax=Stylosanthes scabra TaxID=79078 RepID=A0ABU6V2H2_9FABA|nr:hypothetical protein [Stylosanthes scabra]
MALWCVRIGSSNGLLGFACDLLVPFALFSHFRSELRPLNPEILEHTYQDIMQNGKHDLVYLLQPPPPLIVALVSIIAPFSSNYVKFMQSKKRMHIGPAFNQFHLELQQRVCQCSARCNVNFHNQLALVNVIADDERYSLTVMKVHYLISTSTVVYYSVPSLSLPFHSVNRVRTVGV